MKMALDLNKNLKHTYLNVNAWSQACPHHPDLYCSHYNAF